jgi:hypothetical protein
LEFVSYDEAMDVLTDLGVVATLDGTDRLRLSLEDSDDVVRLHIVPDTEALGSRDTSHGTVVRVSKARLPDVIEQLIHKLGIQQVLLLPIGKWRRVFDAVAFSLAKNEHWREVDATSSMSLNTHDPLLCEPPDFHTLRDLIAAILTDAEQPDQGIMITSTASPLMVELHPDGYACASIGSTVLADEIIRTFGQ